MSLHVKGMDAITTREEVIQAISAASGLKREEVRVGELRPFYGSSQAATVTLPEAAAEKILSGGGGSRGLQQL